MNAVGNFANTIRHGWENNPITTGGCGVIGGFISLVVFAFNPLGGIPGFLFGLWVGGALSSGSEYHLRT